MKTNKFLKWIYGILMALPLLSVLAMTLYVSFNKNAYQSFSSQEVQTNVRIDSIADYSSGLKYTMSRNGDNVPTNNGNYRSLSYISVTAEQLGITGQQYSTITQWILLNSGQIILCDANNSWVARFNFGGTNTPLVDSFEFIGDVGTEMFSYIITYFVTVSSPLNMAFTYSLQQFNDIGFNKVDFISFFDFFYQNTNIYTTFINCYANYILFVSLALFLPRVTLWFINLAFSMIDGFERKSQRW